MARKRKSDGKEAALAETRTLNPRPEAVGDEQFGSSEFFDARDLVQVKYEMVRRATAPTVARPAPARAVSPSAGGLDAELVGLLASMALAVAAQG